MDKVNKISRSLKFIKISVSLPTDLLIKLDLEREKSNETRSGWIKKSIENRLSEDRNTMETLKKEIEDLKKLISK